MSAEKISNIVKPNDVVDHLPLNDEIKLDCQNISTEINSSNTDLKEYSEMPFFSKLTEDRKERYIREFKVKQILNNYSEGKKPESMSDRQWKNIIKQKFMFLTRDAYKDYNLNKKRKLQEKKREAKKQKIEQTESKVFEVPPEKTLNGVKLIVDCAFDDLMLPKEVKSMSTQITRIYNCNKMANKQFDEIAISSFDKRLKERFDKDLTNYTKWSSQGKIKFVSDDLVKKNEASTMIYLSADAEEELSDFEEGKQYIIGGIVDKGRYKSLCFDKAKELNIKSVRLPIGEYIKLHGNKVLTSLHVVQLMNEYLSNGKNWGAAFEKIMPKRKVIEEKTE
ncbi:hypothetical protein QEN19_004028 [Hanseniaspora menglaensis]